MSSPASSLDAVTARLAEMNPLVRALIDPLLQELLGVVADLQKEVRELRAENTAIRAAWASEVAELRAELAAKDVRIEALVAEVADLKGQLVIKDERIDYLEKQLYGKKSERSTKVPDPRVEAAKKLRGERTDAERAARRAAEDEKRKARLAAIPPEVVHIPIPPETRCSCCGGDQRRPLGEGEVSTQYEWVPGRLRRIDYVREKAICACGEGFLVAPSPPQVVGGATYGPRLHAHVVVSKCMDVMPLHRLARAFERIGVPLSVSTLCMLFHRCAESLEPLYKALLERLPDVDILQADETKQPVLDRSRDETRKGWMWAFLDAQAIAFVYDPSRGGKVPSDLLKGSKGTILVDGHTGYNPVTTPEGRERAGCWSHARRGLYLARDYAPAVIDGLLTDIQQLFLVEQEAIEEGFAGSMRHLHLRRDRSGPILDRIFRTLEAEVGQFSPKSSVAQAMRYVLNQKSELRHFLKEARVPIHNNASESALRIVALLRKNALFVGHDEGGRHLAILLSLCATCRLHDVNPEEWMADALIRVTERGSTVEELLPWNWKVGRGAKKQVPDKTAA